MGQSLVGHEGNTNMLSYSAYLPNSGRVEEFLEMRLLSSTELNGIAH